MIFILRINKGLGGRWVETGGPDGSFSYSMGRMARRVDDETTSISEADTPELHCASGVNRPSVSGSEQTEEWCLFGRFFIHSNTWLQIHLASKPKSRDIRIY